MPESDERSELFWRRATVLAKTTAFGIPLLLLIVPLVFVVGRSNAAGVNKQDYVQRNMALIRSLPVFPGAVRRGVQSSATYQRDTDNSGQPIGYVTLVVYRIPRGTQAATVIRFYRLLLARLGWRGSVERIPGVSGSRKRVSTTLVAEFMRAGASLSVGTENLTVRTDIPVRKQNIGWTYGLTVDHHASG